MKALNLGRLLPPMINAVATNLVREVLEANRVNNGRLYREASLG